MADTQAVKPKVDAPHKYANGRTARRRAWCGECGFAVNFDARYCSRCGTKIDWSEDIDKTRKIAVVRCKYCKYYEKDPVEDGKGDCTGPCDNLVKVRDDWFCPQGVYKQK